VFGIVIDGSEVQSKNVQLLIVVKLSLIGNIIDVSDVQCWKAPLSIMLAPMVVTEFGIIIELISLQPSNALVSMVISDEFSGNITDVK
jgi:hypothetical protein